MGFGTASALQLAREVRGWGWMCATMGWFLQSMYLLFCTYLLKLWGRLLCPISAIAQDNLWSREFILYTIVSWRAQFSCPFSRSASFHHTLSLPPCPFLPNLCTSFKQFQQPRRSALLHNLPPTSLSSHSLISSPPHIITSIAKCIKEA